MKRILFLLSVGSLIAVIHADSTVAQQARQLLRPSAYRQAGLETAWNAQVALDRTRSRVSNIELQVVGTDSYDSFMKTSHPVYEVTYKNGVRRFSAIDLGPGGTNLGDAEAHRLAEKEVIRLQARGYEPQLDSQRIPAVVLYVQSSNGTLHAIDAENGRTIWAVHVGRPHHPSLSPAANDRYVAVVNGSSLYLLERDTGEQVWQREIRHNPTIGPTLSPEMVFTPTMSGLVEGHWLPREPLPEAIPESSTRPPTWFFQSDSEVTGAVRVTLNTASWPTRSGRVYVTDLRGPEVLYRFQTGGPIYGSPIELPPDRFAFASTDGYVYCIEQASGLLLWDYSAGELIRQPPVAFGERLYVITEHDNLHCVSATDGIKQWQATRIRQFLSASRDRLYVMDQLGRTQVLNLQTGARIALLPTGGFDLTFVNSLTDRIYLASRDGTISCLREVGAELPTVHRPLPQPPSEEETTSQPSDAQLRNEFQPPADAVEPSGVDPFAPPEDQGEAEDPFAPVDDVDPFAPVDDAGTDDDPFAPVDDGGTEDPFAPADDSGNEDPFAPMDDEDPFS